MSAGYRDRGPLSASPVRGGQQRRRGGVPGPGNTRARREWGRTRHLKGQSNTSLEAMALWGESREAIEPRTQARALGLCWSRCTRAS